MSTGYPLKLRRKKVGPSSYELVDSVVGDVIAYAAKTGTHLDDYPWDWYLRDGMHFGGVHGLKEGGVKDTLKAVVDYIESGINRYGTRED